MRAYGTHGDSLAARMAATIRSGVTGARRLPVGVEAHLFVKRGPDALGYAAVDLAVDDHRIEENAAVLDDDVVEDGDRAGFGVDDHCSRVGGVAERPGVA